MPILKRRKVHNNAEVDDKIVEEVDRMSYLEDTILCHILSFLSIKQAIKTSVLSKRWKDVWTRTPVLDFSEFPNGKTKSKKFPSFVSRVLLLNSVSQLKKLRFNYLLEFDLVHVNSWISNLVLRDIEEVCFYNKFYYRPFDLPVMFFTCVHPVILKLFGGIISKLPVLVKFSNLKVLHLTGISSPNNNLNRLVAGCPVLEELEIYNCKWYCVEIESSTLKHLGICYHCGSINELFVEAPNLEQFSLLCLEVQSWYFGPMKCLIRGKISHCTIPLPVLRVISVAKSLCLDTPQFDDSVIHAFAGHQLVFSNMTNLELEVTQNALLIMPEILKLSPNLVSFIFIKGNSYRIREPTSAHPEAKWITPSTVLDCLSSLKTIEISYFEHREDYLDMVGYFLKNGEVLKEMKLTVYEMGSTKEISLLRKLLLIPRASVTCQVRICSPCED